jgi:anti-sigma-K factor RskA
MRGWETATVLVVAGVLVAANVLGGVLVARRLRGLTIVLLDLEQRLRRALQGEGRLRPDTPDLPGVDGSKQRGARALVLVSAALVAAAAAVATAVWAIGDETPGDTPVDRQARAVRLESLPAASRRTPPKGSLVLVIAPSGRAALVLSRLQHAADGRTYVASTVLGGKVRTLARFKGEENVVPLMRRLPRGAIVKVMLEPGGGRPLFVSKPVPSG